MLYFQSEVIENKQLTSNIFRLTIKRKDFSDWQPGNFAMILPEPVPRFFCWRRAFSIFRYSDDHLEFVIKKVGNITELLQQVNPGSLISYVGPLGNSFSMPQETDKRILLVAGGLGIVPLSFLSEKLHKNSLPHSLLYGAANAIEIIDKSELPSCAEEIVYATEDGSSGFKGKVTDLLASFLEKNNNDTLIYACGPFSMLQALSIQFSGIAASIEISVETLMACGFGACRGCAVSMKENSYKMACIDGPVFALNEIAWEKWL